MNAGPNRASAAGGGVSRQPVPRDVEAVWYRVRRLTLPIPGVREFQTRYEAAVPDLPLSAVEDLVSGGGPWSEMVELIERSAPHGFLIYFRNDVRPVMGLAGDRADCVAYLMGNHVIAERMFRYDPQAVMYAPLHMVIWEGRDGNARFTVDQPSRQFASFGISEITEVGIELDHTLASLLDALAVNGSPRAEAVMIRELTSTTDRATPASTTTDPLSSGRWRAG